mmetsp:Transcript_35691/g.78166  ORF Transcript_35691/g.78166 Transcript_35691/m.78166 type:complete len:381 (+) Transcript_35691:343-1485(+)
MTVDAALNLGFRLHLVHLHQVCLVSVGLCEWPKVDSSPTDRGEVDSCSANGYPPREHHCCGNAHDNTNKGRRVFRDVSRMADKGIDVALVGFSVVMKILGPCLICTALGLICFVTYTYFVYALPELGNTAGFAGQTVVTAVGLFLVSNTLYNYGKSIFTDPGLPPEYEKAMEMHSLEVEERAERADKKKPRQCNTCKRAKPPRCHHCSVCRRCVLKMDHHCPWINNCVGHHNYRYFCLFMLFLAMSCAFAAAVFFEPFRDNFFHVRGRKRMSRNARQCIMTSFMICVSILISLSCLGGFHVYLVLTNQTTIEFQTNLHRRRQARKNGEYYRNPYDLGRTRNFLQVFGPNPFCRWRWLLSWLSMPPSGDGLTYPSLTRIDV